jgi:hypothetical protein
MALCVEAEMADVQGLLKVWCVDKRRARHVSLSESYVGVLLFKFLVGSFRQALW